MKRVLFTLLVACVTLSACNIQFPDLSPRLEEGSPKETQIIVPSPELETPQITPTSSETYKPTALPETPTDTPTPSPTQTPTATPFPLGVQLGSPQSMPNFAYPDLGCQWMGVAGQVFESDGTPLVDLVVEAGGMVAGQQVEGLAVTGSSVVYGPGSYEIQLADMPFASSGVVWVRVMNLDGLPLSAPVYLHTTDSCENNLVLLNFVKSHTLPTKWIFLPLINQ